MRTFRTQHERANARHTALVRNWQKGRAGLQCHPTKGYRFNRTEAPREESLPAQEAPVPFMDRPVKGMLARARDAALAFIGGARYRKQARSRR